MNDRNSHWLHEAVISFRFTILHIIAWLLANSLRDASTPLAATDEQTSRTSIDHALDLSVSKERA
ncbi:hypothetical protein [Dyella flagellata]|uniref:hypothetical protein n=1 Tax=Dyella flagellata TaxID=1867833 RepID=UPI0024E080A5|nr:hypothetical protein [Dyella flagellata]